MKAEELGAWQALLQEELEKPYWRTLSERVDAAYAAAAVYPPREALFAAFRLTPPEAVRAVILGQDPYHEPGQANGLAFSVNPGVKLPPSLRNLFTELQSDCGITPPDSGDLTAWAKQDLVFQAIAEQLDITPTQEQIDSANSSYADTYGAQRSMLNALQLAVLDKVEESAVLS